MDQNEQPDPQQGLIDQVALIAAQPLADRAAGFHSLYEQLLEQLQQADGA